MKLFNIYFIVHKINIYFKNIQILFLREPVSNLGPVKGVVCVYLFS